jgi:hypothetical protein
MLLLYIYNILSYGTKVFQVTRPEALSQSNSRIRIVYRSEE